MSKIRKGEVRNPFGRKGRPSNRVRTDGWANAISAMGGRRDTSEYTSFAPDLSVDINQLQQLYRSDGYAKKIIDLPVEEMMREWIEIENDIDGSIAVEFRNQNLKKSIAEALRWSRLYGGSLCVALIDDGRDLNEPVDENFVEGILGFRVYDRYQISWTSGITNQNTKSMRYGYPEIYRVTPYTVGEPYEVHYTRVLRFDGEQLPEKERLRNQGWGDSVLQSVYRELRRLGATTGYIENIIRQFEQITISVQGLTHLIASNQEEALVKRFQIMDMTRSVLNSIFLDADGEQFAKHSSSVAGLSDLMDRFMLSLSGVTNIPATKLFGRSPSGLNSTGESDIKQFYDYIRSQQEDLLREHLEYVLRLTTLGMGLNPDDYGIKFKSLKSPTEQETVATRFQVAQTDQIYYQMGLDPDVIFKNRFGGEQYSIDTIIDEEMLSDIDYPEELPTSEENLIDLPIPERPQAVGTPEVDLNKQTLNGAQITSIVEVLQNVNAGLLPKETAVALLKVGFGIDNETAMNIVNPITISNQPINTDALEDDIDMAPTKQMADNARRGLELRKEFGIGGTEIGVRRAVQLENRQNLSRETIYRMSSYFARHANYEKESNPPSAGYIAWLLWGGDAGRDWAERKTAEIEAWEQKNA